MTDEVSLTAKQWQRRALKAEAELESIRKMRQFDHETEIKSHREISLLCVAIKEIQETIDWVKANTNRITN